MDAVSAQDPTEQNFITRAVSARLNITNFMSNQGVISTYECVQDLFLFKTSITNLDIKTRRLCAGHQDLGKYFHHWFRILSDFDREIA